YTGENVPAGATAQLTLQTASQITQHFNEVLTKKAWELPAGVTASTASSTMYGPASMRRYGWNPVVQTSFNTRPLRRTLPGATPIELRPKTDTLDWRDGRNHPQSQPHAANRQPHFWAITRTSPGVQTGVKASLDQNSLHLLFGTF